MIHPQGIMNSNLMAIHPVKVVDIKMTKKMRLIVCLSANQLIISALNWMALVKQEFIISQTHTQHPSSLLSAIPTLYFDATSAKSLSSLHPLIHNSKHLSTRQLSFFSAFKCRSLSSSQTHFHHGSWLRMCFALFFCSCVWEQRASKRERDKPLSVHGSKGASVS